MKLTDIILKEDNHGDDYEKNNIKLMGDVILPIGKEMVLQAEEDTYNRGLLVTNNKDKSYDVAYWAGKFEPYPIEVEIDGKSVSKDAKKIKLLFHPEMNEAFDELENHWFIDEMDLDDHLENIHYEWEKWKETTSPDPRDITTAKRDVIHYIANYLKRSLK